MDEAESFLMKSRVRSIWPHSRASWCVGFVECVDRAEVRSVGLRRFITFSGCVAGGRSARAIARLVLLHSHRGRTRVLGRSCKRAGNLFSCVIGFPHLRVRPGWSQDRAAEVGSAARGLAGG